MSAVSMCSDGSPSALADGPPPIGMLRLRSEGGLDGSAQDTPTFVLLGLALVSLVYGIATREGGVEFWPNPFF